MFFTGVQSERYVPDAAPDTPEQNRTVVPGSKFRDDYRYTTGVFGLFIYTLKKEISCVPQLAVQDKIRFVNVYTPFL